MGNENDVNIDGMFPLAAGGIVVPIIVLPIPPRGGGGHAAGCAGCAWRGVAWLVSGVWNEASGASSCATTPGSGEIIVARIGVAGSASIAP